MEKLILEIPTIYRENDIIEFLEEFNNKNQPIKGDAKLNEYNNRYRTWLLTLVKNCDLNIPSRTYFIVRESDNKIIGITTILLKLNKKLEKSDGNVMLSIRPCERGKGYSKMSLYEIFKACKKHNLKELLISCKRNNVSASKSIIYFKGILTMEKPIKKENEYLDFYKINVEETLKNYKNIYE